MKAVIKSHIHQAYK